MLRRILHFITKIGWDIKIISAIKKISFLNNLLLKKGWSDRDLSYYRNIFIFIRGIFEKNNISLQGKKMLEIGSGNLPSLGNFFIDNCRLSDYVASDPYRNEAENELAESGPTKITFARLDFTSGAETAKYEGGFDFVISNAVLEHISKALCEETVRNINRVLKVNGYSFHQIDLRDHLNNKTMPFNFYKYAEPTWETATSQTIFYTNRLRCTDWLRLFRDNGFEITYLYKYRRDSADLPKKIDSRFVSYPVDDLHVSALDILVKKISQAK